MPVVLIWCTKGKDKNNKIEENVCSRKKEEDKSLLNGGKQRQ